MNEHTKNKLLELASDQSALVEYVQEALDDAACAGHMFGASCYWSRKLDSLVSNQTAEYLRGVERRSAESRVALVQELNDGRRLSDIIKTAAKEVCALLTKDEDALSQKGSTGT